VLSYLVSGSGQPPQGTVDLRGLGGLARLGRCRLLARAGPGPSGLELQLAGGAILGPLPIQHLDVIVVGHDRAPGTNRSQPRPGPAKPLIAPGFGFGLRARRRRRRTPSLLPQCLGPSSLDRRGRYPATARQLGSALIVRPPWASSTATRRRLLGPLCRALYRRAYRRGRPESAIVEQPISASASSSGSPSGRGGSRPGACVPAARGSRAILIVRLVGRARYITAVTTSCFPLCNRRGRLCRGLGRAPTR
jgi:hypothetical protein